jgi:hypothetical protein
MSCSPLIYILVGNLKKDLISTYMCVFIYIYIYIYKKGIYIIYHIGLQIYGVIVVCLNGRRLPDAWVSLRHTTSIGCFGGFGGLVVSMLASGIPSSCVRSRPKLVNFFPCEKILSMPSFGGEVK